MKRSRLDEIFRLSISLKGIDGLLEMIGGGLLLVIKPQTLNGIVTALTQHELSQDPHDFIANRILHTAQHLNSTRLFGALYLLAHGAVKLVLVASLLRNKLWAYPAMMLVLAVFIVYQLYRIGLDHSLGLAALTVFDAFVLWLTWREYQQKS